jgi:Asp-tRNA(Asn)/Glu-tRNA(Gln) amidotransferase A subunit family amidase
VSAGSGLVAATTIAAEAREGARSVSEIVGAALAKARQVDEVLKLNVFLLRAERQAREHGNALDADVAARDQLPLIGVPFASPQRTTSPLPVSG